MNGRQKNVLLGLVVFVFLVLAVVAYMTFNLFSSMMGDVEEAEFYVDSFYAKTDAGDYQATLPMFHEDFYTVSSREETITFLEKINEKLGLVKSKTLVDYGVQKYAGKTDHVVLVYDVEREKHKSRETFTLYYEEGSENFMILGYNVNSMGFITS